MWDDVKCYVTMTLARIIEIYDINQTIIKICVKVLKLHYNILELLFLHFCLVEGETLDATNLTY